MPAEIANLLYSNNLTNISEHIWNLSPSQKHQPLTVRLKPVNNNQQNLLNNHTKTRRQQIRALAVTLNCILWWGSGSRVIGNLKTPYCSHYSQVHSYSFSLDFIWFYLLICLWLCLKWFWDTLILWLLKH